MTKSTCFKNESTCFKNVENPSCIDLFLTNNWRSFQNTTTLCSGLSDFHKMCLTVLQTTFQKAKPKEIIYRDYKNFNTEIFKQDLKQSLEVEEVSDYAKFENVFLEVLNKYAPFKKKIVRANHAPYMSKALRKAIMRRSALENKYLKDKKAETKRLYKKQKNYCSKLYTVKKRGNNTLQI